MTERNETPTEQVAEPIVCDCGHEAEAHVGPRIGCMYRDCGCKRGEADVLRSTVATLTAKVDEQDAIIAASVRAKSPCGHFAAYAHTDDGGKTIVCTVCRIATLTEQLREAQRQRDEQIADKHRILREYEDQANVLREQLREAREREAQWNADKDELRRYIDDLDREHAKTRAELRDAASDARIERDAALAEAARLREEIAVADKIIAERDRILDAFPCPVHGRCVPHVIERLKRDAYDPSPKGE